MPLFTCRWEVEIDADTPEEAAEQARVMQLDPENIATFFIVTDESGKAVHVDVDPS